MALSPKVGFRLIAILTHLDLSMNKKTFKIRTTSLLQSVVSGFITTMTLVIFFASVPFISEETQGGFSYVAHATTNDTSNEGKASLRDNGASPLDHPATEHSVAAQK